MNIARHIDKQRYMQLLICTSASVAYDRYCLFSWYACDMPTCFLHMCPLSPSGDITVNDKMELQAALCIVHKDRGWNRSGEWNHDPFPMWQHMLGGLIAHEPETKHAWRRNDHINTTSWLWSNPKDWNGIALLKSFFGYHKLSHDAWWCMVSCGLAQLISNDQFTRCSE